MVDRKQETADDMDERHDDKRETGDDKREMEYLILYLKMFMSEIKADIVGLFHLFVSFLCCFYLNFTSILIQFFTKKMDRKIRSVKWRVLFLQF